MTGGKIPVLLDTDIGNDLDDAVALAYLLKQPRCDLVGITTVTGEPDKRAALAQVICEAAGRKNIPIHAGIADSLVHGIGQPKVPQYEAIRNLPHQKVWPKASAVDFMRKAIRSRPGEITLLSIGPFTNLAVLFALDPEIPSLCREIVSMAGMFYKIEPWAEWNCRVDPIACAMAVNATAKGKTPHRFFGLDVTFQCRMSHDEVKEKFTKPPLDTVRKLAEVWFQGSKELTYHDPLAAACIFEPSICAYDDGTVTVDPGPFVPVDGEARTTLVPGQGPHRTAKSVDVPRFFAEYFSVFR